jgi:hypothetical protein
MAALASATPNHGTAKTARARASNAAELAAHGTTSAVPSVGARLEPNDTLLPPAWWKGTCDDRNNTIAYPLAAHFDGLQVCGPDSDKSGENFTVNFFPGAWGEYEWQCVELSMRWMYLAWGADPYGADGDSVVSNYPNGKAGYPRVSVVYNGTPGKPPQPGDVVSLDDGDGFGHTEVVASSSVNASGNGFVTDVTENNGGDGWDRLPVSHWVVSDIDGPVIAWLHNPNWALEQPVLWDVTTGGNLEIADSGNLTANYVKLASHISSAEVVGGGGYSPVPIVVALTTSGELEGDFYVPGLPGQGLERIASGVKSFSLSSTSGIGGRPVLAWVTNAGNLEVSDGGILRAPITEATGATAVDLAPESGPNNAVIGYLSTTGTFYERHGRDALAKMPWTTVATGVSSIDLASGGAQSNDVVGYTSHGTFYARAGMTGPFTIEARQVTSIGVATIGPDANPLLAYLSGGKLETKLGDVGGSSFRLQATGVTDISVSGSTNTVGFPMIGAIIRGRFKAEDGDLDGRWRPEPANVGSAGIAALLVS